MSRTVRRPLALGILVLVALLGTACAYSGKAGAEQAVAVFHSRIDAGQYYVIYAEADQRYRDSVKRQDFVYLMDSIRQNLGPVRRADWREVVFHPQSGLNPTSYVDITYLTIFEKGSAYEHFTLRFDSGRAVLMSFEIDSDQVIRP